MNQLPAGWPEPEQKPDIISLYDGARLTGRQPRVLQRWVEGNLLPVAYRETTGRKRIWVDRQELMKLALSKRRWGIRRGKAKTLTTNAGRTVTIHEQTRTPSWEGS